MLLPEWEAESVEERAYTPEEMRRYWREHSRLWSDLDRERDPEGLTNVCYNGAPLWFNRFAARFQRLTFAGLLASVGPVQGVRILDVGCGVGRWTRLLSGLGADVVGIDLQSETLRDNRRRLAGCRFVEMSADAQAFAAGIFGGAVSVTVLQHMPFEVQARALAEIRRVLAPGGWYLLLEGTKDRGPHVFSNDPGAWASKAAAAGFRLDRALPYDYAPIIYGLKGLAARYRGAAEPRALEPVERYVSRFRAAETRADAGRKIFRAALHAATIASYPLEHILQATRRPAWAHHVGMLFRAV